MKGHCKLPEREAYVIGSLDSQCRVAEALMLIICRHQDLSQSLGFSPESGMSRLQVQSQVSSSFAAFATSLAGHRQSHSDSRRFQDSQKLAFVHLLAASQLLPAG